MTQESDNQLEKILEQLKNSKLTAYSIAKKTGITEQTILNYRSGKTVPTAANAKLLEYFFNDHSVTFSKKNSENSVSGNNNIIGDNSNIDNRQYYSDSPDVLRAQIEVLDERIKEKDAQIKEKDAQIARLLGVIEKMSEKG